MKRVECEERGEESKALPSLKNVSADVEHGWAYPLNTQVVTGRFFSRTHPERQVYYGQHNIAFAVCRGNAEMVEIMVRHRAKLDVVDTHQNSIVHLCVLFSHIHIFDLLIKLGREEETRKVTFTYNGVDELGTTHSWDDWIRNHRNEKRYTALQAAVAWDKQEMFEHMLKSQRKDGWKWGPLAMFQYPLKEIDTHGLKNPNSVLEVIVSEGRRHFLDIPVIRDIFMEKWDQYGKYMFRFELCIYVIWICTLTVSGHSIDFRVFDDPVSEEFDGTASPTLSPTLSPTFAGITEEEEKLGLNLSTTTVWLNSITAALSIIFILVELSELKDLLEEHGRRGGLRIYFAIKTKMQTVNNKAGVPHKRATSISISGVFKIMVWLRNIITLSGLICVWIANQQSLKVAFVFYLFAIILAFIGLLEYFQLQKHAGRFVIMVLKILIRDVSVFLLVWLVILWGFACSFTLIREDKDFNQAFFFALETSLSFGEYANEKELFYKSNLYQSMGMFIYVLFVLFSVVLLLNLLIAVMAETTQAIGEQDTNRLNFVEQWASTVLKMERRVPAIFYKRTGRDDAKKDDSKEAIPQPRQEMTLLEKIFMNDAKNRDEDIVFYVTAVENQEEPKPLAKINAMWKSQSALDSLPPVWGLRSSRRSTRIK